METFYAVVAFLAGLNVGSFLNVVIWRLPRGESLVRPRSHCPGCDALIAWYDNLPLLSWLLLRGRCRGCKTRISLRYPLVELLTAVLFLLAWSAYAGHLPTAILVAAALAAFVAITFIDLDHRIIPDRITKPGMAVAVALAPLSELHPKDWVGAGGPALNAWLHAGAGVAVGAGVVFAIRLLGSWILRKEAMGLGDVKLLGLIGAVVGPLQVLYALALGCFAGAVIGGFMFAVGKRRPMGCRLVVRHGKQETVYDRVRVRDAVLEVRGPAPAEAGREVRLALTLPAAKILEEQDAQLDLRARVEEASATGGASRMELLELRPEEAERLSFFAHSYRYIPFGPFLALGGALTALYGSHVHWLLTVGYPEYMRSLFR
jgi:leader peptidase (prepilin peptidase)/N-methyltransferase